MGSVSRVARPPFPKTLRQFQTDFATEEACQQYLAACRWPDGFTCPRCGHERAYELANQRRHQCAKCRHQVSLTSGTVLHRTKIPLTHWFWAAYLMATDKRGVSALLLQRQLGLSCYETAWMMLHKLRRAMVNAAREPLRGEVEVDDTWVGGEQAGLRGSRQLKDRRAALVLVAVEKRGNTSGRARMNVIPDFKASTIIPVLTGTLHLVPPSIRTASKVSQVSLGPALNMSLASSRSARSYEKVRSPPFHLPIEPLATSSSGSSAPTTV